MKGTIVYIGNKIQKANDLVSISLGEIADLLDISIPQAQAEMDHLLKEGLVTFTSPVRTMNGLLDYTEVNLTDKGWKIHKQTTNFGKNKRKSVSKPEEIKTSLWAIEFEAPGIVTGKRQGAGVIVFENGHIFGGDSGYYFKGDYSIKDGLMEGSVQITRLNEKIEPLDPLFFEGWNMKFEGKIKPTDSIILEGYPINAEHFAAKRAHKVIVECKWICDVD